ncbi:hypothetical protein AAVH_36666 [Aphelenchoides avenae]|nr:hypothetical protein AAVH_36666 [Aphelenchus avenae]
MLPEIELDVLHFLDRTTLEGLQIHSRYLRNLISRHVGTLPLRYIDQVADHFFKSPDGPGLPQGPARQARQVKKSA